MLSLTKKEKKPGKRAPANREVVTELSERELKQVQGGQGIPIQKDPHIIYATGGDAFYKGPGN